MKEATRAVKIRPLKAQSLLQAFVE